MSEPKTLFIIDVMPLLYKGHFVFLKNPRRTSTGINTSALSTFASSVVQILTEYKPTHMALALDAPPPTFRHTAFPAYKAQRDKVPEELIASVPMAVELARALNIPILEAEGFEADDVLGTLAHMAASQPGWTTYIVTPDKDAAQLVGPNTFLFRPGKGGSSVEIMGEAEMREHWQVSTSEQMIDLLGMAGDTVDNIPGIPGVGEKTAVKLLKAYGSLEEVLAHAGELKGKMAEKVAAGAESARQSRYLATIRQDVPLGVTLEDLAVKKPDSEALRAVLTRYELFSLGNRLLGEDLASVEQEGENEYDTVENTPHTYTLVESEEEVDRLLDELGKADKWAFDTETTGLDPRHDRLVGFSFATEPGKAWYVRAPEEREACIRLLARFAPLFADETKVKIGHNVKFDWQILDQYGIEIRGEVHDSMLAHYVLDSADRHGMDHLSRKYLSYSPIPITELIGEKARGTVQRNMGDLEASAIRDYAAEDADVTLRLDEALRDAVREAGALRALEECEEPLVEVLSSMEKEGVRINVEALEAFGKELDREILQLEIQIRDLGGGNFNPASPKQLGQVLFETLQLDPKASHTASGQYSTSEAVLVKLQHKHPIVPLILDYRACSKLKSTYVDKLPSYIDPESGRVHTSFSQAVTETGRLASSDPNLQNIPIRTPRGQRIRAAFVPRDENHLLISADYSQIELRIMAAMSQDESMIEAFKRGADIHLETASRVYGMLPGLITPEMRSACKMVNFGIIYGISAFGLSQRLNVPRKVAADLIETYFMQYPKIKTFMEKAVEEAREKGYATTLMGRRRPLPDIRSRNAVVRQSAERNAINTPVQGTAADLIKLAMVKMYRELKRRNLRTRMVLQIHDELLFDSPIDEVETVSSLAREVMSSAMDIGVPLDVSVGQGKTWLEAH